MTNRMQRVWKKKNLDRYPYSCFDKGMVVHFLRGNSGRKKTDLGNKMMNLVLNKLSWLYNGQLKKTIST